MNINATTADRIAYVINNNYIEEFSNEDTGEVVSTISFIMKRIIKAALQGEHSLEIIWTRNDNNEQLTQEVEDYLIYKMGYNIEERFSDGPNGSIVIKW